MSSLPPQIQRGPSEDPARTPHLVPMCTQRVLPVECEQEVPEVGICHRRLEEADRRATMAPVLLESDTGEW